MLDLNNTSIYCEDDLFDRKRYYFAVQTLNVDSKRVMQALGEARKALE